VAVLVDSTDVLEAAWVASPAGDAPGGGKRLLRRPWALRLAFVSGGLILLGGVVVAVMYFAGRPHISVTASGSSLADVHAGGFGARVRDIEATSGGQSIDLVRQAGGLVPSTPIAQRQPVDVTATVSAPSWLHWLFGSHATASRTITTSAASLVTNIALTSQPGQVAVTFDRPVSVVDYRLIGGALKVVRLAQPASVVELDVPAGVQAGALSVTAAPFPWEKVSSQFTTVDWFHAAPDGVPVTLADPPPGSATSGPAPSIELTFDQPASKVLGSARPTIKPAVAGSWSEPAPNVLVFTPNGFGFGPSATVTLTFDRPVSAVGLGAAASSGGSTTATPAASYSFRTAPGSYLRMEQILADLHYLPLNFTAAAGTQKPSTLAGELGAMTSPPAGVFSWRWADTPSSLRGEWVIGADNEVLKGALMAFLSDQGTYDGFQATVETVPELATPAVWEALIQADLSGKTDPHPYSYVSVSQTLPQNLMLWQNGAVVLTTAVNTGIASRPTADGTFPIYVRYTVNYMDGTNPDGSKYHDLVSWINYFNGGDAVHGFVRGSYGWPQSLGCVELPLGAAQMAYNDLAIGDLVTVAG
jgi:lipoprotein-anchoring transpeptidase ErfK/SrfK